MLNTVTTNSDDLVTVEEVKKGIAHKWRLLQQVIHMLMQSQQHECSDDSAIVASSGDDYDNAHQSVDVQDYVDGSVLHQLQLQAKLLRSELDGLSQTHVAYITKFWRCANDIKCSTVFRETSYDSTCSTDSSDATLFHEQVMSVSRKVDEEWKRTVNDRKIVRLLNQLKLSGSITGRSRSRHKVKADAVIPCRCRSEPVRRRSSRHLLTSVSKEAFLDKAKRLLAEKYKVANNCKRNSCLNNVLPEKLENSSSVFLGSNTDLHKTELLKPGKHESVESSQALELMSPSSDDCSESSPSASSSASLLSSLLSSSDDCDIAVGSRHASDQDRPRTLGMHLSQGMAVVRIVTDSDIENRRGPGLINCEMPIMSIMIHKSRSFPELHKSVQKVLGMSTCQRCLKLWLFDHDDDGQFLPRRMLSNLIQNDSIVCLGRDIITVFVEVVLQHMPTPSFNSFAGHWDLCLVFVKGPDRFSGEFTVKGHLHVDITEATDSVICHLRREFLSWCHMPLQLFREMGERLCLVSHSANSTLKDDIVGFICHGDVLVLLEELITCDFARCRTWSSSSNLPSTCCSASLPDDANVDDVTVLADCLMPRKQAPLCRSARSMLAHNATVELHATDNHLTGGESCTNDSRSEPMIDSSCSLGHRHVENVILDENICGVDVKATDVKATDALVNDRLDDGGSDNSPPVALSKSRERVQAAASVSPPPEHATSSKITTSVVRPSPTVARFIIPYDSSVSMSDESLTSDGTVPVGMPCHRWNLTSNYFARLHPLSVNFRSERQVGAEQADLCEVIPPSSTDRHGAERARLHTAPRQHHFTRQCQLSVDGNTEEAGNDRACSKECRGPPNDTPFEGDGEGPGITCHRPSVQCTGIQTSPTIFLRAISNNVHQGGLVLFDKGNNFACLSRMTDLHQAEVCVEPKISDSTDSSSGQCLEVDCGLEQDGGFVHIPSNPDYEMQHFCQEESIWSDATAHAFIPVMVTGFTIQSDVDTGSDVSQESSLGSVGSTKVRGVRYRNHFPRQFKPSAGNNTNAVPFMPLMSAGDSVLEDANCKGSVYLMEVPHVTCGKVFMQSTALSLPDSFTCQKDGDLGSADKNGLDMRNHSFPSFNSDCWTRDRSHCNSTDHLCRSGPAAEQISAIANFSSSFMQIAPHLRRSNGYREASDLGGAGKSVSLVASIPVYNDAISQGRQPPPALSELRPLSAQDTLRNLCVQDPFDNGVSKHPVADSPSLPLQIRRIRSSVAVGSISISMVHNTSSCADRTTATNTQSLNAGADAFVPMIVNSLSMTACTEECELQSSTRHEVVKPGKNNSIQLSEKSNEQNSRHTESSDLLTLTDHVSWQYDTAPSKPHRKLVVSTKPVSKTKPISASTKGSVLPTISIQPAGNNQITCGQPAGSYPPTRHSVPSRPCRVTFVDHSANFHHDRQHLRNNEHYHRRTCLPAKSCAYMPSVRYWFPHTPFHHAQVRPFTPSPHRQSFPKLQHYPNFTNHVHAGVDVSDNRQPLMSTWKDERVDEMNVEREAAWQHPYCNTPIPEQKDIGLEIRPYYPYKRIAPSYNCYMHRCSSQPRSAVRQAAEPLRHCVDWNPQPSMFLPRPRFPVAYGASRMGCGPMFARQHVIRNRYPQRHQQFPFIINKQKPLSVGGHANVSCQPMSCRLMRTTGSVRPTMDGHTLAMGCTWPDQRQDLANRQRLERKPNSRVDSGRKTMEAEMPQLRGKRRRPYVQFGLSPVPVIVGLAG